MSCYTMSVYSRKTLMNSRCFYDICSVKSVTKVFKMPLYFSVSLYISKTIMYLDTSIIKRKNTTHWDSTFGYYGL